MSHCREIGCPNMVEGQNYKCNSCMGLDAQEVKKTEHELWLRFFTTALAGAATQISNLKVKDNSADPLSEQEIARTTDIAAALAERALTVAKTHSPVFTSGTVTAAKG